MFIEIIIELVHQQQNVYIDNYEVYSKYSGFIRALRPLFLIDNYLLSGVRRYCEQNIQT